MDPMHQVIWTSVAENDLKAIIEYIAVNNPQNALKILQKIKDKASNLYTLPERGRIVPELQEQGISQYRELIIPAMAANIQGRGTGNLRFICIRFTTEHRRDSPEKDGLLPSRTWRLTKTSGSSFLKLLCG